MTSQRPRILHGEADEEPKPRKRRVSKHRGLIDRVLSMVPGDFLDLPIPRTRPTTWEQRRICHVVDRYVRDEMPEYLYRVRLTAARKVRVSCHVRHQRGKMSG